MQINAENTAKTSIQIVSTITMFLSFLRPHFRKPLNEMHGLKCNLLIDVDLAPVVYVDINLVQM